MDFAITNSPDHSTLQLHLNNQYINVIALKLQLIKKMQFSTTITAHAPTFSPIVSQLRFATEIPSKVTALRLKSKKRDELPTHEGFGAEAGPGSDEAAEVPYPGHGGSRRDLLLRRRRSRLVAFSVAGSAVHCLISSLWLIFLSSRSLLWLEDFKERVLEGKTLALNLEVFSSPLSRFRDLDRWERRQKWRDWLEKKRNRIYCSAFLWLLLLRFACAVNCDDGIGFWTIKCRPFSTSSSEPTGTSLLWLIGRVGKQLLK